MIRNIAVVSDLHCGDQFGLCPDKVRLDGGGYYESSTLQKKVNRMWLESFKWVKQTIKDEPFVLVINGDAIDGKPHQSKTQISDNYSDQISIAETILRPVLDDPKCKKYYHIRGTEAHVGKSGEYEELLAKKLGAIPDEFGNHARWEMWYEIGKSLVHFSHHIGTTGSSSYESTAVYKELVEAFVEAGRWNEKPPSVIVRSHRHRQFETRIAINDGYGIALVTPGFQLKTPFVHRLLSGRASTPQIGIYLLRYGSDDGLYTRFKIWRIERSNTVIA